jgi:hypothetical protein
MTAYGRAPPRGVGTPPSWKRREAAVKPEPVSLMAPCLKKI